jgi:hypothetical protein
MVAVPLAHAPTHPLPQRRTTQEPYGRGVVAAEPIPANRCPTPPPPPPRLVSTCYSRLHRCQSVLTTAPTAILCAAWSCAPRLLCSVVMTVPAAMLLSVRTLTETAHPLQPVLAYVRELDMREDDILALLLIYEKFVRVCVRGPHPGARASARLSVVCSRCG